MDDEESDDGSEDNSSGEDELNSVSSRDLDSFKSASSRDVESFTATAFKGMSPHKPLRPRAPVLLAADLSTGLSKDSLVACTSWKGAQSTPIPNRSILSIRRSSVSKNYEAVIRAAVASTANSRGMGVPR